MDHKMNLNQKLSLIGVRLGYFAKDKKTSSTTCFDYDIEETLILASYEASHDYRLLSLIITWVKIHGDYVIVEKLFKKLKEFEKYRGQSHVINMVAVQAVVSGFLKWKKWITSSKDKPRCPLKDESLQSSIEYQGLNDDFSKFGVLIPKKFLRIRESDVFSVEELAKNNIQYRNRLIYGSSWRADIIAAIEFGFKNPSVIARTIGCSYEPSHRIFNEYLLVKNL